MNTTDSTAGVPAARRYRSPESQAADRAWTSGLPRVYVHRPRIDLRLSEVPDTPLTVVTAAAGAGKTTAVSGWVSTRPTRDDGTAACIHMTDGDVRGLADALVHGLDATCDDATLASPSDVVRRLASSEETSTPPCVVVVDDAHVLDDEARQLLSAALAAVPERIRLVLVSRRDLPFVPAQLTVRGAVTNVRAGDLAFTDAEAERLVRAHRRVIRHDDLRANIQAAQGLPAALVAQTRAMATRAGFTAEDVVRATEVEVLDYLFAHDLSDGSEDLLHVLTCVCQEDVVTESAAVALTGLPDAGAILTRAAEADGLLSRGTDPGGRAEWRLHPLLKEWLRRRTAPQSADWKSVVAAHQRAARHYAGVGDAEAALVRSTRSGDPQSIVEGVVQFAPALLSQDHLDVLAQATTCLPRPARLVRPELVAVEALLLRARREIEAAKEAADTAVMALGAPPYDEGTERTPLQRNSYADMAQLAVWTARMGWRDPEPATLHASVAIGCRRDGATRGVRHSHDLAGLSPLRACWLLLDLAALEAWEGDFAQATDHVHEAGRLAVAFDLPRLTGAVLAHRALLETLDGAFRTAADTARECLRVAGAAGFDHDLYTVRAHLALAWAALHAFELDQAEAHAAVVVARADALLDPLIAAYTRLLRASLATARTATETGPRILATVGDVPLRPPAHVHRQTLFALCQTTAAAGDHSALFPYIAELEEHGFTSDAALWRAITTGLIDSPTDAAEAIHELLEGGTLTKTTSLFADVVRIGFLLRTGSDAARGASELLSRVLHRAAPQEMVWFFAIGACLSSEYVTLLATQAHANPFAALVLRRLETTLGLGGERAEDSEDGTRSADVSAPPVSGSAAAGDAVGSCSYPEMLEPLTRREQQVLEQLALGGRNVDIAEALYLGDSTIKTHLSSLYRKLGVTRRGEALSAARRLGLLDPDRFPRTG